MSSSPMRLICFQSLPSRGQVGLKAYATILHEHWVPVPSLYLNGPGNMRGCKKFRTCAIEMLRSVIETRWEEGTKLVLIIGYLADEEQVHSLVHLLRQYGNKFHSIVIDPICGDDGQAYVDQSIILAYPKLLELGHIHFPNVTELMLISGRENLPDAFAWWMQRFPDATLIVTGVIEESRIGIICHNRERTFRHFEKLRSESFSGSGDLFLAKTVSLHFIAGKSLRESLIQSAKFVENFVASGRLST